MEPVTTTANELLTMLRSLNARAVITKNKNPKLEGNYRERPDHPLDMLDGYWPTAPVRINPGTGYVIHLVEHRKQVWIGDYCGVQEEEANGKVSLVVGSARCFEVTDLNLKEAHQQVLRSIFKKPGAVIYSYFVPEASHT